MPPHSLRQYHPFSPEAQAQTREKSPGCAKSCDPKINPFSGVHTCSPPLLLAPLQSFSTFLSPPNPNAPCSKTVQVQGSSVQAPVQGCLPVGIGHTCTSSVPASWEDVVSPTDPVRGVAGPAWGSPRSFCKSPLHHWLQRCAAQWNQCHSWRRNGLDTNWMFLGGHGCPS